MTAMLRVLSVVAFVAVAHAGIADYSETNVQEIFAIGASSTPAKLINPNVVIEFTKTVEANGESLPLLPRSSSAPAKKDENCGNDLGVVINGETTCTLSALTVKQVEKSGKQGLQLDLAFKLKSEPIVVAVPILKVPSGQSASQQWAYENNVVLAPADIEKLSDIKKQPVKLGFQWLSDLLAQKVSLSTDESSSVTVNKFNVDCKPYITKPLVVSGEVAQKLTAIVAYKA